MGRSRGVICCPYRSSCVYIRHCLHMYEAVVSEDSVIVRLFELSLSPPFEEV